MLPFIRRHSTIFIVLIIFVLALIPRLGAIKQYVTPDEPIWVMRSINFTSAISRGDWASTAQIGHPGVTTMWLGAIGILLKRLADPVASTQAIDWLRHVPALAPDNAEAFKYLGVFLTFARLPVILINALGVVGVFLLARKSFGQSIALLASLLIAIDPFIAGLSGLLHVDGLLMTFSTLSVLSLLIAVSRQQSADSNQQSSVVKWLALSGFFAALAFLSKSPALFLTPFTFLVVLIAFLTKRISLRSLVVGLLSFAICHFAFVISFYPAMWLDPIGTLRGIIGLASFYSGNAVRPTFFDGQYVLNHGFGFYPTALIYRLSPIVMIGLLIAIIFIVREIRRRLSNSQLPASNLYSIIFFLVYAILFIGFITPVAKKYDRYLLPALPMLIFIAAWGFDHLRSIFKPNAALIVRYSLLIVISLQAIITFISWPYLLMSYNLLLGGVTEAQKHFSVGWGEGLGAAANWINAQADGLQSTVATAAIPSFAPIFSGRSAPIDDRGLESADYSVVTLSERQLSPAAFTQLQARGSIIYTVRTGSIEGAWVFNNAHALQQAEILNQANPQTDAIITSIDLPVSRAYRGATKLVTLPTDVSGQQLEEIFNDLSTHYHRLWVAWSPAASLVTQQQIQSWLWQTADLVSHQNIGTAQISVYDLHAGQIGRIEPLTVQFGGNFALIGLAPSAQTSIAAGRQVNFDLRWQALNTVAAPYSVTLQLIDAQGDVWNAGGVAIAGQDQFLSNDWPIGHVAEQSIDLNIPIEAPAGMYGVRLSVDRSDGQRMGLFSTRGNFSGTAPSLTSIEVAPPDQPAQSIGRKIEFPFTHSWNNQIDLLGFDNGPGVVINGDPWTVNLIWRSRANKLPNLKTIWQVFDQNNHMVYELLRPLSTYSTDLWRNGEIIGARYTLRFPVELPAADYHILIGVGDSNNNLLPGGMFMPFDVRLLHRDRSFDQPQVQYPISVTFSDPAIKLIGADYPTSTVKAGDQLPVTVYWQAAATTDTLYKVFIHFETLDGRVLAQIDSDPQGGGMPTVSWATNQFVPDAYPLTIPADTPPGAYQIVVGMYNPLDGTHLIDSVTGLGHVVLNPPIIIR